MEFRRFFVKYPVTDWVYLNVLRPLGYLALLWPAEKWRLFKKHNDYKYLEEYRNRYKGQKCFIIGTGPSLRKEDLEMIKGEVLIGVNALCLWKEFLPDINYFFIGDENAYKKLYNDLPDGSFISSHCIQKCGNIQNRNFNEVPVSRFSSFVPWRRKFSKDITKCIYDFNSVVFLALQFAVYAGFSKIYLLGVDCNYDTKKKYAVDHGIHLRMEYMKTVGLEMIHNFEFVKRYLAGEHIPVRIYNAARGGMLETFPRVKLEDVAGK